MLVCCDGSEAVGVHVVDADQVVLCGWPLRRPDAESGLVLQRRKALKSAVQHCGDQPYSRPAASSQDAANLVRRGVEGFMEG